MSSTPRIVMLGPAPGARSGIAAQIEAYRAHGLFRRWPIDYVATHGGGSLAGDAGLLLRGTRRLGELLGRHRRAVVHVHLDARAGLWRDALFAAPGHALRCPLVLHLHGGGYERFYDAASVPARALLRAALEQAAAVVVSCESLRTWVRNLARHARLTCLPPPVAAGQPAPGASAPASMVLFLGRLEERKGVFDLLEALAAMRAAVPEVRLVCAGEGDRGRVARYAERLGIADAVKFTGWVGPSGKRALFENAAAFALPSYDEGLPVSLLEAMAAGVPPIASALGGIPDAVVDGVSGFLVAPGDTAALARLMRRLLLERALGERVGAAARESVRARYAPERALAQLEALWADLGVCVDAHAGMAAPRADLREAA